MKLKKWVKYVLTIIVMLISIVIYTKTGELGRLAQSSVKYQAICVLAWSWLLLGQIMVYMKIWEVK